MLETLYTAVSLADRYLVETVVNKRKLPCLVTLAVTCLLIAAKIEEPISPSFIRMINILDAKHSVKLRGKRIRQLESEILRTLDFSLRTVSPIFFLERFLRLFGILEG